METIKVQCSLGYIEYTKSELEQEISDLFFLRDAFLVLLNEEVTSKSDIPYSKGEVLEYAKEMYLESSYSKEFIEKCFKQK
tara:strand:- start:6210 stop:6452 length:243 start_codon:yes stop_codon:yes gene_type:complete